MEKIRDYLVHKITLAELVDWAENSLIDGEFIHEDSKQLFDIAAHLGLSDSNQFALSWDELESIVDPLKRHIRGPGQFLLSYTHRHEESLEKHFPRMRRRLEKKGFTVRQGSFR